MASAEGMKAATRTAIHVPRKYPTLCSQTSPFCLSADVAPITPKIAKALIKWEQHRRVVDSSEGHITELGVAYERFSMNVSECDLSKHCCQKKRPYHFSPPVQFRPPFLH